MLLNTLIASEFLITDELMYNTYSGQLSADMITRMLKMQRQFWWVNYALIPVLLSIKLLLSSSCVWIGIIFSGNNKKHKEVWRVFLLSEFIFILQMFIRIVLLFFMDIQTMEDINNFQPFSLFSLLDVNNLPSYLRYPTALINIFEVTYWFVLAHLLGSLMNGSFRVRLGFVFKTYGIGLLIWVSLMIFLTLNLGM